MNFLPEIFDKQAKFKPWLWEKYGDTFDDEKNRKKTAEREAELKYKKDRMMHGKKKVGHSKDSPTYKQFVARAKESKLKRGEVKKFVGGKWVSNKD
tara:strand:- start:1217 stop:1504 length:288 start_codon:yes stop_codon:yes gene_type:complete